MAPRIGTSKLTDARVREIRALLAMGVTVAEVAKSYGVLVGAIYGIRTGRRWRHVPTDVT